MSDGRLIDIIGSGWPQVLAIFGVIWWSRKIDLRSQEHSGRLDRHENRLIRIEQSIQAHALNMARVEEALSGIKLTLDRIYQELRDKEGRP